MPCWERTVLLKFPLVQPNNHLPTLSQARPSHAARMIQGTEAGREELDACLLGHAYLLW